MKNTVTKTIVETLLIILIALVVITLNTDSCASK